MSKQISPFVNKRGEVTVSTIEHEQRLQGKKQILQNVLKEMENLHSGNETEGDLAERKPSIRKMKFKKTPRKEDDPTFKPIVIDGDLI